MGNHQHNRNIFSGLFAYRAKAGVLQLTLGISLVMSALCASSILLVYYSRLTILQSEITNALRDNAHSAVEYVMSERKSIPFNKVVTLDLFGEGTDSVQLIRKPWGLFEVAATRAWRGKTSFSRCALITAMPDKIGSAAVYLPENNSPLYMVGVARIQGTAYVSEKKFSTGYVDGRGFERKVFIEGKTEVSKSEMPQLDTTLVHLVGRIIAGAEIDYNLEPRQTMSSENYSFGRSGTNYYFSNQSIDLEDTLRGNVIIHSAIRIRVLSRALLRDVILIAPVIDFDNDVHATAQCFALKRITIGARCRLNYPSALALMDGLADSTIVLRRDAVVEGLIMVKGYGTSIPGHGVLNLESGATFHGVAYINGASNIRGTVKGSLITKSFIAYTGSSPYGNHLLDGHLDGNGRSPHMPGSLSWTSSPEIVLAKWLD